VTGFQESARHAYVAAVLRAYRATPGVIGRIRQADRQLAGLLFDRGIPFYAVANALILAAARRVRHNAFTAPLPPVKSLHYFVPVIREVLQRPPGTHEIAELRQTLRLLDPLP